MSNLRIAELDFDSIKSNLKDFLKNYTDDDGAPYFTDFDYEGSGLSILLDVLSYNTHYNAYLASMVINEMFLDSAVKRASAVSIAKHLGYTPLSVQGARAKLTFDVINPTNTPNFLTLEKFTPFTTTVDEATLTFVNLDSVTIQPNVGTYTFKDVEVVEGIPLEYTYTVDLSGPAEKYVIPNENVDTTTIRVIVQNSYVDTTSYVYDLSDDTLNTTGSSKVYFLEENSSGKFQIHFGDNILGKKLSRGNLVKVTYLVSNGILGNVAGNIAQEFYCGSTIGGGTIGTVITPSINSRGGINKEDIDSIKFKAPKFSAAQNRAVTSDDYKSLIEKNYPLVESISVWGGDQNDPPKYGKVIISLKPYDGYYITQETKNDISNLVLQNKQVLSIVPEFIEPEYFYINLSVNVKYNQRTATISSTDLKNSVVNIIYNYFANDLQKFDKDFVYSKLLRNIDAADISVIGNLMTVNLQKRIDPVLNLDNHYVAGNTIKFKNGIEPGSIQTTRFVISSNGLSVEARIKDLPNDAVPNRMGTGKLILVNADTNKTLDSNYCTVDYASGILNITNLIITGYTEDTTDVRITATVQDSYLDITVNKNEILLLDDSTFNGNTNRLQGLTVNTIAAIE
jgi:hypothetical protein